MYLKSRIKHLYNNWYNDSYIYEKDENGVYKSTTFGKFIEDSLGIAKYLIDNGYKNKNIMIISENSTKLMEFDLAVSFYVGVCAIVSKEWKKNDILSGLEELNADVLIYSSRYETLINDVKKDVSIKTINMNSIKPKFSK